MRTRRRAKYTWLPNVGFQGDNAEDDAGGFPFTVAVPSTGFTMGDPVIAELLPDFTPEEPTTATDPLVSFIGNDYILKRIVGKLFAQYRGADNTAQTTVIFGAGFFVARYEEGAPQLPIGASTASDRKLNYGVLNNQNTREPWIWRRVWQLRNATEVTTLNPPGLLSTQAGASVLDGPHIDSKSARRIRNDERLYFTAQVFTPNLADAGASASLDGWLDYRCLGALRKAKNRSAF